LFLIYTIAAFLLFVITDIVFTIYFPGWLRIWQLVNLVFSLIELSIFFLFYRSILNTLFFIRYSKISKIYLLPIIILMAVVIVTAKPGDIFTFSGYFSVAFYFILLIPPILYFYEVLKENKELDKKLSLLSVWLFAYGVIALLPTVLEGRFFHSKYLDIYRTIVGLHYITLIVLCYCLVIICRKERKNYNQNIELISFVVSN
jgi:hypothetical protein